jgi:amidohydrolase
MGHAANAPSKDELRALAEREVPAMVAIRRDLHMHPEIGYEEVRTSGVILRELSAMGVRHVGGLAGGTGVLAHFPAPHAAADAGCIALRADMDALPIHERSTVAHASRTPGRMHACGHDGHVAILLGTARVLAALSAEGRLTRPVTLVFQPAEEGGGGGKRMVEDGALDGSRVGPPVTEAHALHGWPDLAVGTVASVAGPVMAASDRFEIRILGEGAHAAWPHRSADPVTCAAAMVAALQTIVSRNVDPLDAAVVSVTVIEAGSAFNVIPDRAVLRGTLRSLSESTRCMVERRVAEVADGIARAHGCQAEVDLQRGYPVTVNHAGAVERFLQLARHELGADRVVPAPFPVMGGEDFAFLGQKVPSCYWALGLARAGERHPALHAPDFDFNDDALGTGIRMMTALAVR